MRYVVLDSKICVQAGISGMLTMVTDCTLSLYYRAMVSFSAGTDQMDGQADE